MQQLLQREIDLLEQKAIKNPFLKKEIDQTKVLLYEMQSFDAFKRKIPDALSLAGMTGF